MFRHSRRRSPLRGQLLQRVWRVEDADHDYWIERSTAYITHYKQVKFTEGSASLGEPFSHEEIVQLVEETRSVVLRKGTVQDIQRALQQSDAPFSKKLTSPEDVERALSLVLSLWLFVYPSTQPPGQTVAQLVRSALPVKPSILPSNSSAATTILSEDFCAKSLTRKGGFFLVGTADISKHLTFEGQSHLKIVCHARVLRKYQRSEERILYPDGFLEEVDRTINLLFPTGKIKAQKRVRKISRKQGWDIESYRVDDYMLDVTKHQCSSYPYFGERLAEIQHRFAKARPRTLAQWWFDRRNPREWAALWVAVLVFVLGLIFGIISAVTGIMQVYAAYHFNNAGQ